VKKDTYTSLKIAVKPRQSETITIKYNLFRYETTVDNKDYKIASSSDYMEVGVRHEDSLIEEIIDAFYSNHKDVKDDIELQEWVFEISTNGFSVLKGVNEKRCKSELLTLDGKNKLLKLEMGNLPPRYLFTEQDNLDVYMKFQNSLLDIENKIEMRNKDLKYPYDVLLPSKVPCGIAI